MNESTQLALGLGFIFIVVAVGMFVLGVSVEDVKEVQVEGLTATQQAQMYYQLNN